MALALDVALIAVAAAFALFAGANDGGALLVTSLNTAAVRPLTAAVLLIAAVIAAPAIFGTGVASTLAGRLVAFQGSDDRLALVLAVTGAIAVVVALARAGLPTSLTLALIGGIVGVGIGGGLPIAWTWVAVVLLIAAAAPVVGLLAAYGLGWLWRHLPVRIAVVRQVRHGHRLGLVLQAFAYGSNDGQKMLCVFALAVPAATDHGRVVAPVWMLFAVGGLFAVGLALGVRRYGRRLRATVPALTPVHTVTAQLSAAMAVTGSAAAGAPVSMTQSITGALIGSSLSGGTGRIRWRPAAGLVAAWVLTLPVAGLVVALPAMFLIRW